MADGQRWPTPEGSRCAMRPLRRRAQRRNPPTPGGRLRRRRRRRRAPRHRRTGEHLVDPFGGHREHDARRRFREPRDGRAADRCASDTCAPHSPAIAISASAIARPPSEQSWTPSTTRSRTSATHQAVERGGCVEIDRGRRAVTQPVRPWRIPSRPARHSWHRARRCAIRRGARAVVVPRRARRSRRRGRPPVWGRCRVPRDSL